MKIILDAMGGDNAPLSNLQGALAARSEFDAQVILVGDAARMTRCAQENNLDLQGMEIVNTSEVVEMCDEPTRAIRTKKDSILVVGLRMLAEGKGDAFVSAGSTGALHVGASLIVRTMKGIKRPALATYVPGSKKAYLLLDSGANVECRAPMLNAFATMGSVYAERVLGVKDPTVGLVNNGAEESKGTPLYRESYQLLKANPNIHFAGNVEPRDIPAGTVDVVVCDGFTGNVILKLTEGLAKSLMGMVKQVFLKSTLTKLAALILKDGLRDLKKQMDSEEVGGAPLLGTARPVIKAHGSSSGKAIKNAIRQAQICVENDLCGTMAAALLRIENEGEQA